MSDRRKELGELVAKVADGSYREHDMLVMLSQIAGRENIDALLADLPEEWRPRFTAWMIAMRDNPALLPAVPLRAAILERTAAWLAKRPPIGGESKPPLTDEDRAVLEQMLANREKRVQEAARQDTRKPLPADSPLMKRWENEEFLAGDASDGSAEDDVAFYLKQLAAAKPESRANSLRALSAAPLANEQLLAACEAALADRTITLLGIPYSFGEVRWHAVNAVAAIRGALGRKEPAVIEDGFHPLDTTGVSRLAEQTGIPYSTKGGTEGAIETLERIAAAGKVPRRRIERDP